MKALLLLFLASLIHASWAQKVTVKEAISTSSKGVVLKKGMRLDLSDSVRVEVGGLLMLTEEKGVIFLIPAGRHEVRTFYERKMSNLTHADSLQMLLTTMGVTQCDSIERANQRAGRSMYDAMSKKESSRIQLKGSVSGKYQVHLTWKGKQATGYVVIASDLMEELVFVKESNLPSLDFDGQPYENLLLRVFAKGCHFSNHIVLLKKNGQMTVVK